MCCLEMALKLQFKIFQLDVMFGSNGVVVTSLAITYLTLKSESKVNQGHCH